MNWKLLVQHSGLFVALAAVLSVSLSAYGQNDVRRILRASVRRFGVFVVGTVGLAGAMALLEHTLLALD